MILFPALLKVNFRRLQIINHTIAFTILLLYAGKLSSQIPISEARNLPLGTTVTIGGVVTNGDELGDIRFVQDETGAIAVYPGSGSQSGFLNNALTGYQVEITGVLKNYYNLLELDPVISYTVNSIDEPLPEPIATGPEGVNESNESRLIRVENVHFNSGAANFTAGIHTFTDGINTGRIYLNTGHPMIGTPIPDNLMHITGISSQYDVDYQLLPRGESDLQIADAFYFTLLPEQKDIVSDGFKIHWQTNIPGSSGVRYGTTPNMPLISATGGSTADHEITLTGLNPATIYYLQAFSTSDGMSIDAPVMIAATASLSSGEIRVYFNHSVDESYSNGSQADGSSGIQALNAILNKIEDAQTTIDMWAYNINTDEIVEALNQAVDRGVRVRFITDVDSNNSALDGSEDFPVLEGNPDGIMHNKVLIIDADDAAHCWLITGSMNFTDANIFEDYNNMLLIQDQTLARTYTLEFEEMWGGDGDDYDVAYSRFGNEKADNTPHLFNIGGKTIRSYFSPSEPVTQQIASHMLTADASINFGLLTFTSDEIAEAIASRKDAGVLIKGIIDNTGDVGSEFNYFQFQDIPVVAFEPASGWQQFHHKYGIIDADLPESNPTVITGSHNWTAAAQNINDENTLIIYDADIANLYRQEFFQRWCELTDCSVGTIHSTSGKEKCWIFPNPANEQCQIQFSDAATDVSVIGIMTSEGQWCTNPDIQLFSDKIVFGTDRLTSGLYRFLFLKNGTIQSVPFVIIH